MELNWELKIKKRYSSKCCGRERHVFIQNTNIIISDPVMCEEYDKNEISTISLVIYNFTINNLKTISE